MPPVANLAVSTAATAAQTNQATLAAQAGDTLSCLAGSSPGDFFFSLYSGAAVDGLLSSLVNTGRGRASLAEGTTAEQAALAIAMEREYAMSLLTHGDYLIQAVGEVEQDKIYYEHQQVALGLILTANTVEQRGF